MNRVKIDNRIVNLREATGSQNKQNVGAKKSNRSGLKGIWWDGRIKDGGLGLGLGVELYGLVRSVRPRKHTPSIARLRKHFGEYARFA